MHFSSDGRPVGTRITAALPRIVVVLAGCLLASATIGFAAEVRVKPQRHHAAAAKRHVLVVPDVRQQVFVFAKGMLEDDGFGWKVEGSVHGFAPNRVVSQSPAPGTRVVDTGSPKITLGLERDTSYAQEGSPEDRSPYTATKITRVVRVTAKAHKVSTRHVKARPAGRIAGLRRFRCPQRADRHAVAPDACPPARRLDQRAPVGVGCTCPPLAQRARLDHHRREVRLVGRRAGAQNAHPCRPES